MPSEEDEEDVVEDFVWGATQDCFLFIIAAAISIFEYMILLLSLVS